MINILSYVGMSLQSEVCLWTLLGLVRTIFDATLFKVNANLKQVWQMSMPEELSRPVQRALRTMISGIMLVQCFTVYVYLASYIVLLYPVFLEERPTLVLPWLLLAAIRKLLCELTSLALGLGTCVLLGPARPPCIKFVVIKVASIMPSFYMWMLLYSYYHVLKMASAFKTFPAVLPPSDHDYGLELAVRRRRTKSLQGEQQLRTTLIENLYNERQSVVSSNTVQRRAEYSSRMTHSTDTSLEDLNNDANILQALSVTSNPAVPDTSCDDWFGTEVLVYRDTDRILEQFGLMMLRIAAYLTKEGTDVNSERVFDSTCSNLDRRKDNLDSTPMPPDHTDPPPLVGSSKGKTASYLQDYPQIFMKKSEVPLPSDIKLPLASDDRISTQRNQVTNANENAIEETSTNINPTKTHSFNSSEKIGKKLQAKSSEKAVTFREKKVAPKRQGEESIKIDSLQSINENVESPGVAIEKSLNEDENKNDSQDATTSRHQNENVIKPDGSSTSDKRDEETNTPGTTVNAKKKN